VLLLTRSSDREANADPRADRVVRALHVLDATDRVSQQGLAVVVD
jgi:hypothetical protein